jgi:hypothetical protein
MKYKLLDLFPFYEMSRRYYLYVLCGTCLYGSMVPFWFMGGKYLQDYYDMDVTSADSLMLLPEGAIVLVSLPLGMVLDKLKPSLPFKLQLLSVSCLFLPISYFLLCIGCSTEFPISPVFSMCLLGIGYAFSNSTFWAIITLCIGDQKHLGIASGLVCSSMNLLPTLIPPLVARFIGPSDGKSYLALLSLVGLLAFAAALMASFCPDNDMNSDSNSHSNSNDNIEADAGLRGSVGGGLEDSETNVDIDGNSDNSDDDIELSVTESRLMSKLASMIEGDHFESSETASFNSQQQAHSLTGHRELEMTVNTLFTRAGTSDKGKGVEYVQVSNSDLDD